ncbi:hypothetical protein REPUB_Repub16aG0040500 [Reevesia pubescens]
MDTFILSILQWAKEEWEASAWTIWNDRNREVHGEQRRTSAESARFSKVYLTAFKQAQEHRATTLLGEEQRWSAPNQEFYKANFDGAVDKKNNVGGIEVLIRNEKGEVMGAYAARIEKMPNPFTVEAMAAAQALV